MYCKRVVKLTAGLGLLQLAGYVIFIQYNPSWSIFSQFSASTNMVHFARDGLKNSKNGSEIAKHAHINIDIKVGTSQLAAPITAFSKSVTIKGDLNKVPTTQSTAETVASSNKVGNVVSSATVNVVNNNTSEKFLVQEVTNLLKTQLQINNTMPPFSVKRPCVPKPQWNYACVHPNCTLSNNISERVHSLVSEKTMLTKAQDDLLRSVAAQIPETDVILLTAASSNHFDEMQAMLHTLHSTVFPELSKHENFSLVVWDIGLTLDQRQKTEKCCRCQVISFPFEKFPQSIRTLRCYMWKPLVIRMSQLRARKYAVWQDASIRFVSYPGPVFENGRQHGLQLIRQRAGVSVPHRTLPETFAYLGQKVCDFYPYPEVASGFGVYKNDPFVLTAVTNPWARCGFEKDCMCPKPYLMSYRCYYGPCHRFDQSALTIITTTLYSSEVYKILLFEPELKKYFWVGRNSKEANYFQSTGCLS